MSSEFDLASRIAWPTLFFTRVWQDHAQEAPSIIQYLYELKDEQTANIASGVAITAKSRAGLYESDFDLLDLPHPGLEKLKGFIEQTLQGAIASIQQGVAPQTIRPQLVESWFHITNNSGFHDAHFHSQCSWCGIYYLQAGDCAPGDETGAGNGVNRFYSPIPSGGAYMDIGNSYLSTNRIDITPREGMLLLFPSYLLHSALPYQGQQDRIVISFNSQASLRDE